MANNTCEHNARKIVSLCRCCTLSLPSCWHEFDFQYICFWKEKGRLVQNVKIVFAFAMWSVMLGGKKKEVIGNVDSTDAQTPFFLPVKEDCDASLIPKLECYCVFHHQCLF